MSKLILFVGAVLAMGLTWFLAAIWFAEHMLSLKLEGAAVAVLVVACFAFAAYPAWRLFINPKNYGSR